MWAFFKVFRTLKTLLRQIVTFLDSDVDKPSYIWTIAFLGITCTVNYCFLIDDSYLEPRVGTWMGFWLYFLLYGLAYYGVAIPVLLLRSQNQFLKQRQFWIGSLFFLTCIAADGAMTVPQKLLQLLDAGSFEYWAKRSLHQWQGLIIWIPVFWIFKQRFQAKEAIGLYGIRGSKDDLKPYYSMLWIMIPLITAASFLPDFQRQYPTFKRLIPFLPGENSGEKTLALLFFEIPYLGSFLTTEMMFRGGLGLGMYVLIGRHALLPMVSVYMFLHFGKPLGESLSSVLGGYILGVLAIQNRNIWGGFFIHGMVAFLMDLAATLQIRNELFNEG